jgi:hypothetical protein
MDHEEARGEHARIALEPSHEAEHRAHRREEIDRHAAAEHHRQLAPRVRPGGTGRGAYADEAVAGAEAGRCEIPVGVRAIGDEDVDGIDEPDERLP